MQGRLLRRHIIVHTISLRTQILNAQCVGRKASREINFQIPNRQQKTPANSPRYFADFIAEHDGKEEVSTRTPSDPPRPPSARPLRPSRRSVSSTVTDERRGEGVSQVTCLPSSPGDLAHEKPSPAPIFSLYSFQNSISGTMIIHFKIFNEI